MVLTWVTACSSTSSARPFVTSRSVSMATVRVASSSRSRSSARSAYRPNQYRSLSTRGTMAIEADMAGTNPASSSARMRATILGAATGSAADHPDVFGELAVGFGDEHATPF